MVHHFIVSNNTIISVTYYVLGTFHNLWQGGAGDLFRQTRKIKRGPHPGPLKFNQAPVLDLEIQTPPSSYDDSTQNTSWAKKIQKRLFEPFRGHLLLCVMQRRRHISTQVSANIISVKCQCIGQNKNGRHTSPIIHGFMCEDNHNSTVLICPGLV